MTPARIHVVPLGDLRPHDATPDCWCRPSIDEDEPCVVVHNAMDGREQYETGERKPS